MAKKQKTAVRKSVKATRADEMRRDYNAKVSSDSSMSAIEKSKRLKAGYQYRPASEVALTRAVQEYDALKKGNVSVSKVAPASTPAPTQPRKTIKNAPIDNLIRGKDIYGTPMYLKPSGSPIMKKTGATIRQGSVSSSAGVAKKRKSSNRR
jgi:exopolysaccharide biosynthesis protein